MNVAHFSDAASLFARSQFQAWAPASTSLDTDVHARHENDFDAFCSVLQRRIFTQVSTQDSPWDGAPSDWQKKRDELP